VRFCSGTSKAGWAIGQNDGHSTPPISIMTSPLSGLIAAPFTPFRPDGVLAPDVVAQQARLLVHNGVSGAFICGTTGEGYSLSLAERRAVAEAWREAAPTALKLVVHVGHLCLADSCELARHAQTIGADAVATIAPSFFKPASAEDLVSWCECVAAAAPQLPFYYYHMPAMTGLSISVADFLRAVGARIPNLVGVKFTHENLMDYGDASLIANGRYAMLFGRDEILLAGLALGAAGAVGSTYNTLAPLFREILRSFDAGDLVAARRAQAQARDIIAVVHRHGGLAAGKTLMRLVGVDCGPVRLPLRSLTAEQEASLRQALEEVGFFQVCSRLPA
jgi:N-acetylneuraminate lyase